MFKRAVSTFTTRNSLLYTPQRFTHAVLHDDLQNVLVDIRKERNFKTDIWIPAKVEMMNNYMSKNGLSGQFNSYNNVQVTYFYQNSLRRIS